MALMEAGGWGLFYRPGKKEPGLMIMADLDYDRKNPVSAGGRSDELMNWRGVVQESPYIALFAKAR